MYSNEEERETEKRLTASRCSINFCNSSGVRFGGGSKLKLLKRFSRGLVQASFVATKSSTDFILDAM